MRTQGNSVGAAVHDVTQRVKSIARLELELAFH
jgi:hypothetical protein